MDGKQRKNITVGLLVDVVQKQDQPTGRLTRGRVARLLTKSLNYPHGIKVTLESGTVDQVQYVIEEREES